MNRAVLRNMVTGEFRGMLNGNYAGPWHADWEAADADVDVAVTAELRRTRGAAARAAARAVALKRPALALGAAIARARKAGLLREMRKVDSYSVDDFIRALAVVSRRSRRR